MSEFDIGGREDIIRGANGETAVADWLVQQLAAGGGPTTGGSAYLHELAKEVLRHRATMKGIVAFIDSLEVNGYNTFAVELRKRLAGVVAIDTPEKRDTPELENKR